MTYFEKLKDPRWQKRRLELFNLRHWACELCSDSNKPLHAHHTKYIKGKEPWEYSNEELKCLCEDCHSKVSLVDKILTGKHESEVVNDAAYNFKASLGMLLSYDSDPESVISCLGFLSDMMGFIDPPSRYEFGAEKERLSPFIDWVFKRFCDANRLERNRYTKDLQ